MTTTNDAELLPTDDDVAFYREHGYWISPPALPDHVLDAAAEGAEQLYRGQPDRPLPDGRWQHGWKPADGDVLRKNDYSSLNVDRLASLVRHPYVAACAARLAGAESIRLWHDQLLYKPPQDPARSANVGWHTDRQYWMTCSSTSMLTAWIPFHDVDLKHGAVNFVDGSSRWEEDVALNFFDQDLSSLKDLRDSHDVHTVPAEIPRGAMSFHNCRTIHGSGPNLRDSPRRAIAVHLQPGENHFVRRTTGDGNPVHHGNDTLVRTTPAGDPDYADPAVCPQLFPKAG